MRAKAACIAAATIAVVPLAGARAQRAPGVDLSVTPSSEAAPGTRAVARYHASRGARVAILRVDTDGRVTVLAPAAPRTAGERGSGAVAFRMLEGPGAGYVFAIAAWTPFDFRAFSTRGRWSLAALGEVPATDAFDVADRFARRVTGGRYAVAYARYIVSGMPVRAQDQGAAPPVYETPGTEYGGYAAGGYVPGEYIPGGYSAGTYSPGGFRPGGYVGAGYAQPGVYEGSYWYPPDPYAYGAGGRWWSGYPGYNDYPHWRGRWYPRWHDRWHRYRLQVRDRDPRWRYDRHCPDGTLVPYDRPCPPVTRRVPRPFTDTVVPGAPSIPVAPLPVPPPDRAAPAPQLSPAPRLAPAPELPPSPVQQPTP